MTSASLLIVTSVGLLVGALAGLALDGRVPVLYLGILAGFVATLVASLVRNSFLGGVGPSTAGIDKYLFPLVVILSAFFSCWGGRPAAVEVPTKSDWAAGAGIGAIANRKSTLLNSSHMS